MEGRGTETKESLQKRLDTAQEALEYGRFFFLSVLIFPELLLHELQLAHGIFQFLTNEIINKLYMYLSKQLPYEQQINMQYEINENSDLF